MLSIKLDASFTILSLKHPDTLNSMRVAKCQAQHALALDNQDHRFITCGEDHYEPNRLLMMQIKDCMSTKGLWRTALMSGPPSAARSLMLWKSEDPVWMTTCTLRHKAWACRMKNSPSMSDKYISTIARSQGTYEGCLKHP